MNPKVSILKCNGYDEPEVYRSIKAAVDLVGSMRAFARKGERILLKPNMLFGKPADKAVTTHPSVVKAVIRLVKETGAEPFVGDSPGMGSASTVAEKSGILKVCEETGTPLIDLKTLVVVENPAGATFKRLEVAKEAIEADGIINLPKLKTHIQMYLTLGVKNLFGCVPGKLKPQWHLSAGVDTMSFAGMLTDLYLYLSPRLTILDGVVAMEGNGPGSGDPKHVGLICASEQAVALDRVVTEIVGARQVDVPILRYAKEAGVEGAEPAEIEVVGEEPGNVRIEGFRFPPLISANLTANLPGFIDTRVRRALTTRPHVADKTCTLCGACVDVCPAGVMVKSENISIDYDRCIRCYCCQEICPEGAISVKRGWLKRVFDSRFWQTHLRRKDVV